MNSKYTAEFVQFDVVSSSENLYLSGWTSCCITLFEVWVDLVLIRSILSFFPERRQAGRLPCSFEREREAIAVEHRGGEHDARVPNSQP